MQKRSITTLVLGIALIGVCWVSYAHLHRQAVRGNVQAMTGDELRFADRATAERLLRAEVGGYRKIHVFVALADNLHQCIERVPAAIGNGQAPGTNLYWGARYGVKTYFTRSPNWRLVEDLPNPAPHVLERLIFRHAGKKVYLVADAYNGADIRQAIIEAVLSSAGMHPEPLSIAGHIYVFGGGAQLVAYVGHNALLESPFPADVALQRQDARRREAIFLCCISHPSFAPLLQRTGAYPLLTTTQFMCPEAYTLETALTGWINHQSPTSIHEQASRMYSRYQHCSVRAAGRLLRTGF